MIETSGWSGLTARITGRFIQSFWRMAYANNPFWLAEREGVPLPLEPIGAEACRAVLDAWGLVDSDEVTP